MADDQDRHRACVAAWLRGAAKGAAPTELLVLFERAVGAIWQRAQVTLGDVTLAAIADRVLYTAGARFPALDALKVEPSGVRFDELRTRIDSLDDDVLAQAVPFALVELLTVLGHLTAEILAPALHEALLGVTLDDRALGEEQQSPEPQEGARNKRMKRMRSS